MAQIIISSNYSVTSNDLNNHNTILVDATLNPVDVQMPAGHSAGQWVNVKDWKGMAETNAIRVVPFGAATIDTQADYTLSTNYQSVKPESDGSNWVNT